MASRVQSCPRTTMAMIIRATRTAVMARGRGLRPVPDRAWRRVRDDKGLVLRRRRGLGRGLVGAAPAFLAGAVAEGAQDQAVALAHLGAAAAGQIVGFRGGPEGAHLVGVKDGRAVGEMMSLHGHARQSEAPTGRGMKKAGFRGRGLVSQRIGAGKCGNLGA